MRKTLPLTTTRILHTSLLNCNLQPAPPSITPVESGCNPCLCMFAFVYFFVAILWHHLDNAMISLIFFSASAFITGHPSLGGGLLALAVCFFFLAYLKRYTKDAKNPNIPMARHFFGSCCSGSLDELECYMHWKQEQIKKKVIKILLHKTTT